MATRTNVMPKPRMGKGELPPDHFWIKVRWDVECHECGTWIGEGERAVFDYKHKNVFCEKCGEELED